MLALSVCVVEFKPSARRRTDNQTLVMEKQTNKQTNLHLAWANVSFLRRQPAAGANIQPRPNICEPQPSLDCEQLANSDKLASASARTHCQMAKRITAALAEHESSRVGATLAVESRRRLNGGRRCQVKRTLRWASRAVCVFHCMYILRANRREATLTSWCLSHTSRSET